MPFDAPTHHGLPDAPAGEPPLRRADVRAVLVLGSSRPPGAPATAGCARAEQHLPGAAPGDAREREARRPLRMFRTSRAPSERSSTVVTCAALEPKADGATASAARMETARRKRRRTGIPGWLPILRRQELRPSADRILTPVPGRCLRGFSCSRARSRGACGRAGRSRTERRAARPRRPPRQRHQPGHAGVRRERGRPRRGRRLRGDGARPRHARRSGILDAGDRQALPRLDGAGGRLRRAVGLERRLRRRRDHDGVRPRRDGAADEHRLVDADLAERRGHLEGPAPEDRQRRRRLRRRARARARPQRRRGPEDGHGRVELRRARGEADRSRRGDRADPSCAAERDRRDEDRSEGPRPRTRPARRSRTSR